MGSCELAAAAAEPGLPSLCMRPFSLHAAAWTDGILTSWIRRSGWRRAEVFKARVYEAIEPMKFDDHHLTGRGKNGKDRRSFAFARPFGRLPDLAQPCGFDELTRTGANAWAEAY